MEPPVTPKPMSASLPDLSTDHMIKLLGIVYITLTGVIDTMILAASPWSWVGKSMPYLIKLAPSLRLALSAKSTAIGFLKTTGWQPKALGKVDRARPQATETITDRNQLQEGDNCRLR
ncbi:hypothetical protein DSO57_1023820 [Entomophthora muscae]|uniref:Uncharacterized protein n=1 Tax=Entomophthora muscae TaxID=34485 RepID=A0ACC2UCE6_9FUNG|nr:hypothetical protein DSO57_1023820 [Entomophthora muscae]